MLLKDEQGRLLKVAEAAELLRISPSTLYRLVERGSVPVLRIGSQLRFDPTELERELRREARRP